MKLLLAAAVGGLIGYVACQLKWEARTEEADRSGRTLQEVR